MKRCEGEGFIYKVGKGNGRHESYEKEVLKEELIRKMEWHLVIKDG